MSFKKSACTNDIYISSQETIDNSDDDSRSGTGNDLETQVCPSTAHRPQRHAPTNHRMQNNRFHLSQETNMTEHSAVTTETFLEDNALSSNQKKRKLQGLYYGTSYKPEDKYEILKVRNIVRESIFKHVKFCRGEGSSSNEKSGRKAVEKNAFGRRHDTPDITLRSGYAHEILKLSGNGEDKKSLTQRALWWKTYNIYVLQEIRQVRSSKNFSLKKSCIEGMCTFYALIFICFYIFDTTNICLVILTGSAEVSATSRLKKFQDTSDRDNQEGLIDWNQMLAKLMRIVGKEEFIDLRLNEDTDLFRTFLEFCLIHFVSSTSWRWKAYNVPISEIFTPSDEAMAMLLLENSIEDLRLISRRKEKILRRQSRSKYTKVELGSPEKFQGWHNKGIRRYNQLFKAVSEYRKRRESKDLEETLQQEFAVLCGKSGTGTGDGEEIDDDYDGDDNSTCTEAIDGFVGELPQIPIQDIETDQTNDYTVEEIPMPPLNANQHDEYAANDSQTTLGNGPALSY